MRFVSLFALLAFSTPALAQDSSQQVTAKPADKPVCRRINTTGSIMGGKKICHTKVEWAKIDGVGNRDARRDLGNNGQNNQGLNRN